MGGFGSSNKNDKDDGPQSYNTEDAKKWMEEGAQKSASAICAAVYGWDGTGKCIREGTLVENDGELKPVEGVDGNVHMMNGDINMVKNHGKGVHEDTVNEILEVAVESGINIEMTPDHRVFTPYGWKAIEDIDEGEFVAVPKKLSNDNTRQVSNEEAYALGALIGDGGFTGSNGNRTTFTNKNEAIIKRMENALPSDVELKSYREDNYTIQPADKIRDWTNDCGVKRAKSVHKRIPKSITKGTNDELVYFLSGLFDTDGNVADNTIVFNTSSKMMADEIKHYLLRIGIIATKIKRGTEHHDAYRISVSGTDAKKLAQKMDTVKNISISDKTRNPNYDVIPSEIYGEYGPNTSWYNIGKQYGYSNPRDMYHEENLSRERLRKFAKIDNNNEWMQLAQSDIAWLRLKNKNRKNGNFKVYDLGVPDAHNFVANDLIVHNSGVCMDCRTEEEIEQGKKVVVFDLDGSAGPLKHKYFDDDENIVIFDPMVLDDQGDIDYVSMYNKMMMMTKYLLENQYELDLKAVIFDGLDKLLKCCEFVMKFEDLKINPDARVGQQWDWGRRNRRYYQLLELVKKLDCDRFFITHYKDKKNWSAGSTEVVGKEIDWHDQTGGMMFQKIEMSRRNVDGKSEFVATVEKAKGALHLEDSEYTVAEVRNKDAEWYGLSDLWEELRESTEM